MKMKDWEIYQKIKLKSNAASEKNVPAYEEASIVSGPRQELRQVVKEIEKLPDDSIILATKILKQFLN